MSSKKDKNKQFEKFCEAFKKANPLLDKNLAHKEAMKQWNDLKKLKNPETAICEKMQEYRLKTKKLENWAEMCSEFPKPISNTFTAQPPHSML